MAIVPGCPDCDMRARAGKKFCRPSPVDKLGGELFLPLVEPDTYYIVVGRQREDFFAHTGCNVAVARAAYVDFRIELEGVVNGQGYLLPLLVGKRCYGEGAEIIAYQLVVILGYGLQPHFFYRIPSRCANNYF